MYPSQRSYTHAKRTRLLLSAPQRSPAVSNEHGTHALFTVSTYSIESNTDTKQVQTIDLKNEDNPITLFSEDKSIEEPQLLIGTQILWKTTKDGVFTEVWIAEAVVGDMR